MEVPDRPAAGAYSHIIHVPTRSEDINQALHVSAVSLGAILENGRVSLLRDAFGYTMSDRSNTAVLARNETDFLKEVYHPAALIVATGIGHVGRTSFTFDQALFNEGVCVCRSRSVYVNLSEDGPSPFDDARREALAGYTMPRP